jgi:cytochrome P450
MGLPHNVPHYHPFSMGVRACPGQRIAYNIIKVIAGNLLLGHRLEAGGQLPFFSTNLMLPVTPCRVLLRIIPVIE